MSNIIYSLNTCKNTLIAQTHVLNTIAHNIANANTPGYSRQRTELVSIPEMLRGRNPSMVKTGAGVEATMVSRSRFALYDEIFRNENQNYNAYVKTEDLMHQVELLFDEPSDRSLSGIINDFFNAWQDVGSEPLNMAARQSLQSIGTEMTSRLHRIFNQLQIMQINIDNEISALPNRINEISSEIAGLNESIRITGISGNAGNDLRDKRDLLIDELSDFVDVRTVEQDDGTVTLLVGNNVVVERELYTKLKTETRSALKEDTKKTAIISEDGNEYFPRSGKLGGLLNFRDEILPEITGKLNKIAEALVVSLNFEHRNGYGLDGINDRDFFDPNKKNAFNIKLSNDIDDVTHIAISGDGTKGDNSNAMNITLLKNVKIIDQAFSISEYYNSMIADIGIMGREARSGRMNEELLVGQIDNAREGIKGVSIDEELIQMIQTQHIYQAASRMIIVLDELFEVIISMK